ncbi:MAG: hypothetical protein KAW47_09280 [Thermoplasmatales archaeon]|nr:hypothetical protein [Thermoplasmatales archaeon]
MKTLEELKEYRHEYYIQHKDQHYQYYLKWCGENSVQAAANRERWDDAHPHYYRDYMRKRKAVTEPLIFGFLDNCSGDMDGFIIYLRTQDVPEQHLKWFKVDIQKYLGKCQEKSERAIKNGI